MQVEDLLKLTRKSKLDELESAWSTVLREGEMDELHLLQVPRLLVQREQADLAETLLWYLVDSLQERGEMRRALRVARRGGGILRNSDALRDVLADLYTEVYGGERDVRGLVDAVLRDPSVDLDQAVKRMDHLLSFQPGQYVMDPQRGAVGRVGEIDADKGRLAVDFGHGEKGYGPALAGRLEPVESDDFRALGVFERDRVAAMAKEDPEELVRIVLSTLDRRMELRRLRLYLEPVVGSWQKWWSRARETLKRSSVIGMTPGNKPSLFLRSKPLSHGERLVQKVRSASTPMAKLTAALGLLKEMDAAESPDMGAVTGALDEVCALARTSGGQRPTMTFAALAVADVFVRTFDDVELPGDLPDPPVAALLAAPESLPKSITVDDLLLCTLDYLRRQAPEGWVAAFAAVMPLSGRAVCDMAARRLAAAGAQDALSAVCQEIISRPDRETGALVWLWRRVASMAGAEDLGVDPAAVVLEVLSELAALVRKQGMAEEGRRQRIAELRTSLFLRDGAPLSQALEGASSEKIRAIKAVGENNPALTDRMLVDLMNALQAAAPKLFQRYVPPWEQDVTYATPEGIEKRRAELEYIANVRLPEVMREIGQAAGFGDLSENAEYSAALEERGRLAARAGRMQDELANAKLITRELAEVDHVTIGSRVRARNLSSGEEETLTFLGPWDAQPEQGVYAYNAPLGLVFMGKSVGDTVVLQMGAEERSWEVLEISPAL